MEQDAVGTFHRGEPFISLDEYLVEDRVLLASDIVDWPVVLLQHAQQDMWSSPEADQLPKSVNVPTWPSTHGASATQHSDSARVAKHTLESEWARQFVAMVF